MILPWEILKRSVSSLLFILTTFFCTFPLCAELVTEADEAYNRSDYRIASQYYEKLINSLQQKREILDKKQEEQLIHFLFNLAICYQNLGEYTSAIEIFRALIEKYRTLQVAAQAQLATGNVYYLQAQKAGESSLYSKAYENYGEVLWWPPNPFTDDAILCQALVNYRMGNYAQADKILRENSQSLQSWPDKFPIKEYPGNVSLIPKYLWLRGEIAIVEERYEEALKIFSLIAEKYPQSEYYKDAVIKTSYCRESIGQQKKLTDYSWNRKAEFAFYKAERLFKNKSYEKAINAYRDFLSEYPDYKKAKEALTNLGFCYYFQRLDYEARAIFSYLTQKYPRAPDTTMLYYHVGLCCWRQQRYDKASEWFTQIIKYSQDEGYITKALHKKGWCEYIIKDYTDSINSFEQFLKKADKGWQVIEILMCLADIHYTLKDYEKSLDKYTQILDNLSRDISNYGGWELNKNAIEKASYLTAWCKYEANQPDDALVDFQTFAEKFPESYSAPTALDKAGEILSDKGSYEQAGNIYEKLIAQYPDSKESQNCLMKITQSLCEKKKHQEAAKILTKIFQKHKDKKFALEHYIWLARTMDEAGEPEAAVGAYNGIITHYPQDPYNEIALYKVANYEKETNNFKESIQHFETLLKKYPETGFFFEANFSLGDLRKEDGDYKQAIEAYKEILRYAQNPLEKIKAEYNIGDCFYLEKKYQKALTCYQRVVLLYEPDNTDTKQWIAKCLYRSIECFQETGQKEKAKESGQQFLERYPEDPLSEEVKKHLAQMN